MNSLGIMSEESPSEMAKTSAKLVVVKQPEEQHRVPSFFIQ